MKFLEMVEYWTENRNLSFQNWDIKFFYLESDIEEDQNLISNDEIKNSPRSNR